MTVGRIAFGKEAKTIRKLIKESEQRLQDKEYAQKLLKYGYKVSEKYLSA